MLISNAGLTEERVNLIKELSTKSDIYERLAHAIGNVLVALSAMMTESFIVKVFDPLEWGKSDFISNTITEQYYG